MTAKSMLRCSCEKAGLPRIANTINAFGSFCNPRARKEAVGECRKASVSAFLATHTRIYQSADLHRWTISGCVRKMQLRRKISPKGLPGMADATLLDWANKQPNWARDALRRHCEKPGFKLGDVDRDLIASTIRQIHGSAQAPAPQFVPITSAHLKASAGQEKRSVLCSLGPVKHLNRLAEEQQLRFALNGITLVYGDNGSGKSGYCRIAKKLCRSLTADDLLGNVFEPGATPPAQVLVRYMEDGMTEPTAVSWEDGSEPPAPIARISVFDSANARLYVDKQNKIGFLPSDIALLQQHGSFRLELETQFREELKTLERNLKVALPGGYSAKSAVAQLLSRLDAKAKVTLPTVADFELLSAITELELAALASLEFELANDPATSAKRRRRVKAVLERYLELDSLFSARLSPEAIKTYSGHLEQTQATAAAAKLAASQVFLGYPIKGVGSEPWRLMFEYALAFAQSASGEVHEHLPDQEGLLCLLCLEPLSPKGSERLQAFNQYITGAANTAAHAAEISANGARMMIEELDIPGIDVLQTALGEFGDLSPARKEMISTITAYFDAAHKRRQAVLKAKIATELDPLPILLEPINGSIAVEITKLEAEAVVDEQAAADDKMRAADRIRRDELRDRKKLLDDLPVILARLSDLQERAKLLACCEAVERGSVSRHMTTLRRSLVMESLEKRIVSEIEALGLTHIPFSINDKSQDGNSYFEVGIDAKLATPNNKVLSEGEQRALALACFLAEVGGDTSKQGIIIDDPVSSLDHIRLRRVAHRLVKEAVAGRQVIIFTHNLLFFNEVYEAAAQSSPQVDVVRNYISNSEVAGFGLISETDEPWIQLPVSKRIDMLAERHKSYAGVTDFKTDAWRRSAKDFYTDLRETWERLVEEVLLGKVVERFSSDVRTQSLKLVSVEDDDHKIVFWAMKRVSERSGHDMAAYKSIPVPTPDDIELDLQTISQYRAMAHKRKAEVQKRRELLEKPPKAAVI
ncbi:energy-coupling factor transporter ATP-binding protein EcfA2 [Nitrobacteraceae bacterium AZCC 2161]